MFWALIASLFFSLGALIIFIYYLRSGQFEDAEDVKYQMFRDDERKPK
jgi:cbb3-type cytochrome oxidase maturation protein